MLHIDEDGCDFHGRAVDEVGTNQYRDSTCNIKALVIERI